MIAGQPGSHPRSAAGSVLAVAPALAISLGALDGTIALLISGSARPMHPFLLGGVPFVAAAIALLAGAARLVQAKRRIHPRGAATAAFAVVAIPFVALIALKATRPDQPLRLTPTAIGIGAIVAVVSILLAIVACRAGSAGLEGGSSRTIRTLALCMGAVFLIAWLVRGTFDALPVAIAALVLSGAAGIVTLTSDSQRLRYAGAWTAAGVVALAPFLGAARTSIGPISGSTESDERTPSAPSIVLVSVDTLRWDSLGTLHPGAESSPGFDALAAGSVVFDSAYSSAPWTVPALGSLITGLPESAHRMTGERPLPEALPTLAELLRASGYRTAAIGSNPWIEASGLDRGFDDSLLFPMARYRSIGSRLVSLLVEKNDYFDAGTDDLTDFALEWVRLNGKQPFFLWLHYLDPHDPYTPPAPFAPSAKGTSFDPRLAYQAFDIHHGKRQVTADEKAWLSDLYQGEVRYLDDNLGRLVAGLRDLEVLDQALVVATSDHGEEFWDHGSNWHGHSLYDELIRVPLVVKPPHSGQRLRVREPVSTASVAATILDVAGVAETLTAAAAPSLAPHWEGGAVAAPVFATGNDIGSPLEAVVFDGFKLIRSRTTGQSELYDLGSDPGERSNVASERPEIVDKGERLLDEHLARAAEVFTRLGAAGDESPALDPEVEERLRSLGYLP